MSVDPVDRWDLICDALDAASTHLQDSLARSPTDAETRGRLLGFQERIRDLLFELATLADPVDWHVVVDRLRGLVERCPLEVANVRHLLGRLLGELTDAG